MTVTALIHVNLVNGVGTNTGRTPSLLLPGLENMTALHYMQVYCRDLDGNQLRAEPAGWVGNIVRDVGSLAVIELHVRDEYWSLVTDSFSTDRPMVTGFTLDDFKVAALNRYSALFTLLEDTSTVAAMTAGTPWLDALANDLAPYAATDPMLNSVTEWVNARVNGDLTAALPTVFGTDFATIDYDLLKAFRVSWANGAEDSPIRQVTRLWELARMHTLVMGL
jgi:hypothetical protein